MDREKRETDSGIRLSNRASSRRRKEKGKDSAAEWYWGSTALVKSIPQPLKGTQ